MSFDESLSHEPLDVWSGDNVRDDDMHPVLEHAVVLGMRARLIALLQEVHCHGVDGHVMACYLAYATYTTVNDLIGVHTLLGMLPEVKVDDDRPHILVRLRNMQDVTIHEASSVEVNEDVLIIVKYSVGTATQGSMSVLSAAALGQFPVL